MALSSKAAINLIEAFAAAVTLGFALAPSNALAVTTWNWSFATDIDQFGSGTFTTADVVPTAGTTYQITGVSGTFNAGGTAFTITGPSTFTINQFRWNGTTSSSILSNQFQFIGLDIAGGNQLSFYTVLDGFSPIAYITGTFGGGNITSSSLAPYSPPSTAVPGPLPLLGAAAAFQASRRLRRRLNGSLPAA